MNEEFFADQHEFRKWLEKNYHKETELYVGFYFERCGKKSMTFDQSVNQALCFGWVDGVRKTIDEDSYCIRFTPKEMSRVPRQDNVDKIKALCEAGMMHEAGLRSSSYLKESKPAVKKEPHPPPSLSKRFMQLFK
jgi:uncharacterized protein YdeI (YjbR/CyaY-like superfamily)